VRPRCSGNDFSCAAAGSPDSIAMPQAFYFHLEGLTSVQDKHGLKMPDPKHANDHSRTTASKKPMDSRVRGPSVVVVVVDERGAEIGR
jgi:hypothetical protein